MGFYDNIFGKKKSILENTKKDTPEVKITDTTDASVWVNKGNALVESGMYEEAVKCYDKALEKNTSLTDVWNNKGLALARTDRYREAIQCYDMALKLKPDDQEVIYNKGIALSQTGLSSEAIACFDRLIEINPGDAAVWCSKGDVLFEGGKFEEALLAYDRSIKINPKDETVWNNRGLTLVKLDRLAQAVESYDKALEINPSVEKIWSNKGLALKRMKQTDEAIDLQKVAYTIPKEAVSIPEIQPAERTVIKLGMAGQEKQKDKTEETRVEDIREIIPISKPPEGIDIKEIKPEPVIAENPAVPQIVKEVEIAPTRPDAESVINEAKHEPVFNEKLDASQEEIKTEIVTTIPVPGSVLKEIRAEKIFPEKPKTGQIEKEKQFSEKEQLEESFIDVHQKAPEIFEKRPHLSGEEDNEDSDLIDSLPLKRSIIKVGIPKQTPVDSGKKEESQSRANGYLVMGNTVYSMGKYEEAIDSFNKALQIDPENSIAWNNKGLAFVKMGDVNEAINCYDNALKINPRDPVFLTNKGNALYKTGDFNKALECYKSAITLNPDSKKAKKGLELCSLTLKKSTKKKKIGKNLKN